MHHVTSSLETWCGNWVSREVLGYTPAVGNAWRVFIEAFRKQMSPYAGCKPVGPQGHRVLGTVSRWSYIWSVPGAVQNVKAPRPTLTPELRPTAPCDDAAAWGPLGRPQGPEPLAWHSVWLFCSLPTCVTLSNCSTSRCLGLLPGKWGCCPGR